MNKIFLISDTHFGHKKILDYEAKNRPFASIQEHDEELVRRWNAVVKKDDTVWHLGDVLFGTDSFSILGRLNGRKRLVLGNHDHYPIQNYLEYFDRVVASVKLRECILTHIPVHPSEFVRFKANIHGHLHSNVIEDKRYINVCADRINLTPIELDKVI